MATQNILPKANYKTFVGVVANVGKNPHTLRVRVPHQTYNSRIHKYYDDPKQVMVHDPRLSCNVGDVISLRSQWRVSKTVRHVVTSIVSPFGRPLNQRPPVPSEHERLEERAARRRLRDTDQAANGRKVAIARLKQGDKLAKTEALDEAWALKRVNRQTNDMRGLEMLQILVGENDLDLFKQRITDTLIAVASQEERQWAREASNLQILTLWLALKHASEKHLHVGKTLAIRAGRPPHSAVVRESELMAAFMARRSQTYHDYFCRLNNGQSGRDPILRALQGTQKRMTRAWRDRVFETREPDARKARQERRHLGKVGSDPAVIASEEQAWLATIRAVNEGAKTEVSAERRYWHALRAAKAAAVDAVVAEEIAATAEAMDADAAAEAASEINVAEDEVNVSEVEESVAVEELEELSVKDDDHRPRA